MSNKFILPELFISHLNLNIPKCEFQKGEIVFILGPNGSGKTTLLREYSKPTNHFPALYMSSQFQPQDGLTGNDLFDLFEVCNSPYLNLNLLKDFKIEHLISKNLSELSSGERQKIFLAAALFNKNHFIALDEPLNFLDVSYHKVLKNYLLDYKNKGRLIFLSNHDFYWAQQFENSQTWFLANSRLKLQGDTLEVLNHNLFKTIFNL